MKAPTTNAFLTWFGDSKVVDGTGKPITLYHGTSGDWSEFSYRGPDFAAHHDLEVGAAFYFTDDVATANWYAESSAEKTGAAANVRPVYLSFQNPRIVNFRGAGIEYLAEEIEQAKDNGNDGLIVRNYDDGSVSDHYIAFEPAQIRSTMDREWSLELQHSAPALTDDSMDAPAALQTAQRLRQWFGSSQVVDAQGEPLVVYHGTAADFSEFSATKHRSILNDQYQGDGFHFTADPDVAGRYAEASRNQFLNKEKALLLVAQKLPPLAAKIFKAVVDEGYAAAWAIPIEEVRTIIDESAQAGIDLNDLLDIAEYVEGSNYNKGREPQFDASMIFGGNHHYLPDWVRKSAVLFGLDDALPSPAIMPVYLKVERLLRTDDREQARSAQANGYDGVFYTGDHTVGGQPEYIVFNPEQIKSAIGNLIFDPASPSLIDQLEHGYQPPQLNNNQEHCSRAVSHDEELYI